MKNIFSKTLLKMGIFSQSTLPVVTKAIAVAIVSCALVVTTTSAALLPTVSLHEGIPTNLRTSSSPPEATITTPNIIFSNFVSEAVPGTVIKQEQKMELRLRYLEGKSKVAFLRIDMADIEQSDITSAKLKLMMKGTTANFTEPVNLYLCGVNESSGEIINETTLKWNKTMASGGTIGQNKRLIKPNDGLVLEEKNTEEYIELDFTEFARTTKYLKYIRDDYFSQTTLSLCIMADSVNDLVFTSEVVENNPMIAEITVNGDYTPIEPPTIPLFGLDDPSVIEPPQVKPPIPAYEDDIAYGGFASTEDFNLRYPIDYDSVDIDPSVPEYPETVEGSEWAPLGYVDVTLYGADPTGTTDSTVAIQNAVKDAYDYNMATYVPEGTYLVSDTIDMYSPKGTFHNIRRRGSVMVGSTVGTSKFVLTDNNPNFDGVTPTKWQDDDETIYLKPVFYLWVEDNNNPGRQKDNENYNNILRNVTIDLGNGNPGAVGVRHRGCEGSSLENITVYPRDGFAGILGMLGSGGIMSDITVDGGRYGIYSGGAQEVATLVGFNLTNQTEMAVYFKATCPLTLVGGKIEKDGGVFIGGMDRMPHSGELQEGSSLIGLYDVSMENTGNNPAIALGNTNRGIYGLNVYTKGIDTLVSADDSSKNVYLPLENTWKHIEEFSWAKEYTRPMGFVDGIGVEATSQNILIPEELIEQNDDSFDEDEEVDEIDDEDDEDDEELPPSDLVSRHVYPFEETSIDWLEANNISYANIRDYGAVGDGITDDTDAFKQAIADEKYVFIPRGVYKITDTISLESDTRLFGVSKTITVIRPVHTNDTLQPAFETPDDSDADCIMSSFKVLLPNSEKNVAGILWQSGKDSIMHGMWVVATVTNDGQTASYWIKVANNGGGRIYDVIGIGQFDSSNIDTRLFLVENTSNPLFVYHLHTQHVKNDQANAEVRNSENVVIFSVKGEVTYKNPPRQPAILLIKDSENVLVMGYGGNYSATNGDGCIKIEDSEDVTVCNMGRFMPHRNGQLYYYYVFEAYDGEEFNSVDAEDYLNYYKRGHFSHISLVD